MQSLVIAQGPRNPNGHTEAEILSALRGEKGTRYLTFRYELLSDNLVKLGDLDHIESCSITNNKLAEIKRTAKFELEDRGEINFQKDRIKPWIRLHLPPYGTKDYVEWPQGVFLLSTPTRHSDAHQSTHRSVEGYDGLQHLHEDLTGSRQNIVSTMKVTDRIKEILTFTGVAKFNVTPSSKTAGVTREWPPGLPWRVVINRLCRMINYESLFFDENGVAIVRPYLLPRQRPASYTYRDARDGLIIPEVDQTLDTFNVANKWIIVVSEPDRPMIKSITSNTDPSSPTSTVSRGRIITDFRTEMDAVDQATLDDLAQRYKHEASQIFENLEFETALWPPADGTDIYNIRYSPLAINHKYSEIEWTMDLVAGATMKRKARRVVNV